MYYSIFIYNFMNRDEDDMKNKRENKETLG